MKTQAVSVGSLPRPTFSPAFVSEQHEIAGMLEAVVLELEPHFLPDGSGCSDPQTRHLFQIGLRGSARTMRAIAVVLECGWPAQGIVLARSLHELSVQLLWASREPGGAERMVRMHLVDNRASLARQLEITALTADERAPVESVIAQLDAKIDRLTGADVPTFDDMIAGIIERDVAAFDIDHDAALSICADHRSARHMTNEVAIIYPQRPGTVAEPLYADLAKLLATRSTMNVIRGAYYAAHLSVPDEVLFAIADLLERPLEHRGDQAEQLG